MTPMNGVIDVDCLFYSKTDLRQKFGCSSRTLERWIANKQFPKPAMRGRWLRATVDEFIEAMRQSATCSDITKKTY